MSFIKENQQGKSKFSQYESLGFAVNCMLMNKNYSLYHIKTLQLWTQEAINQNQFKILFDHLDNPLGYITWAYLRDETLGRFINDPQFLLHTSEWDEGGTLCILDFAASQAARIYVWNTLKQFTQSQNVARLYGVPAERAN
ncbi:toxin-activating lysine-acyltransferase [Serratia marcescens]|nr:toxin-activating lysine-acyltransferase [Serratia marcescens]